MSRLSFGVRIFLLMLIFFVGVMAACDEAVRVLMGKGEATGMVLIMTLVCPLAISLLLTSIYSDLTKSEKPS